MRCRFCLKPYGWTYFTVDIQWYEPHSRGHGYEEGATLQMDAYSRLTPALIKFPSAANDKGFAPLANYVHSKGLKFGIHIMRGIPKQAVMNNTAIFGTTARAADIANQRSTCDWNPDMFGVDMSKEGAQAYYDSLFELYASWGVDLIKVDDISRPYDATQQAEIEAIRKAIDKNGSPNRTQSFPRRHAYRARYPCDATCKYVANFRRFLGSMAAAV